MATKEDKLKELKDFQQKNIGTATHVYSFHDFKQGEVVQLVPPNNPSLISQKLNDVLTQKDVGEEALTLTGLLYYHTLKDLGEDRKIKITGNLSLDDKLASAGSEAETTASAAFLPQAETICVRKNLFTGSERQISEDILCVLHETRHYHQALNSQTYARSLDGEKTGTFSDHERLSIVYNKLKKQISPNSTAEELEENKFAIYYQNPLEIDAREYSLKTGEKIIEDAIKTNGLSEERKDWLINAQQSFEDLKEQNNQLTQKTEPKFNEIKEQTAKVVDDIQSKKDMMLTEEKLEILTTASYRDPRADEMRDYLSDLEASLMLKYDEETAQQLQEVAIKYKVYGLGKLLVINPDFNPSKEFLDKVIKEDVMGCMLGSPTICPPYDKEEVINRFAEMQADNELGAK